MDIPLATNDIGIHQGLQGRRESSTFCQNMADVVGLSALKNICTVGYYCYMAERRVG